MKLYSITDELVPYLVGEFATLELAGAKIQEIFNTNKDADPSKINFFIVKDGEVKWWDENCAHESVWHDCEPSQDHNQVELLGIVFRPMQGYEYNGVDLSQGSYIAQSGNATLYWSPKTGVLSEMIPIPNSNGETTARDWVLNRNGMFTA